PHPDDRPGRAGRVAGVLTRPRPGPASPPARVPGRPRPPRFPATPRLTSMSAKHTSEVTISSDLAEARRIQEEIASALQANSYSEHDIFSIRLALEEALVNAIKHGNQMDPDKRVFVTYCVTPTRFEIKITDEGAGFNPEDVPDPTAPENLERPC